MIKIVALALIFFCSPIKAQRPSLVLKALMGASGVEKELKSDDALFPMVKIAQAVHESQKGISPKTLRGLERILLDKEFQGRISQKAIELDGASRMGFWRDAAYLTLARAYYRQGDGPKAIQYFRGVSSSFPLYAMARVELVWSLIQEEQWEKAQDVLSDLDFKSINKELLREADLQEKFLFAQEGDFQRVIDNPPAKQKKKSLENIRRKLLSQVHFDRYLAKSNKYSYQEKIAALNIVLSSARAVSKQAVGPAFAFLVSEALWHQASTVRVKSPIKKKKQWTAILAKADQWISPWVNRSLAKGRAFLSEEAMFFSIALAWERDDFRPAIRRLKALPQLFPQGEYLSDSYQLLGDYYFEQKKFNNAVTYYRLLADRSDEQKAAYGVYKAAWSFYNAGDKMASLRHFQRLMNFYQKRKIDGDAAIFENDKVGLYEESKKDFFTVLAEQLPFSKARREFSYIGVKGEELVDYQALLGDYYQNIGRFDQAAKTFQTLIAQNGKNPKAILWLSGLLQAHLSAGERKAIARDLNRFYPIVEKENEYNDEDFKEFEKNLHSVILTAHREARKSGDQGIWAAVDSLYRSYQKHFKDSKSGDIWYFGAQRQEKMNRPWRAVFWYQRASRIEGYKNRQDAALSALRIAKQRSEDLSIKEEVTGGDRDEFKKIAQVGLWYSEKFAARPQRELAESLYLEGSYYIAQHSKIVNYITNRLEENRQAGWKLFKSYNGRFYRAGDMKKAFAFAKKIQDKAPSLNKKKKNFLKEILQESAFQVAFTLEKRKGRAPANDSSRQQRQWYRRSIASNGPPQREIKAWNNLAKSYSYPQEGQAYGELMDQLQKRLEERKSLKEEGEILKGIFSRAASLADEHYDFVNAANWWEAASQFVVEKDKREAIIWEALVLYGTFHDFVGVERLLQELKKSQASILRRDETRLALSKIYFYGAKARPAWRNLKAGIDQLTESPQALVLVRDLWDYARRNDEQLKNDLEEFLQKNRSALIQKDVLRPLWAHFDHDKIEQKIATWQQMAQGRTPSAIDPQSILKKVNEGREQPVKKMKRSVYAENQLKVRLSDVGNFFRNFNKIKTAVSRQVDNKVPQMARKLVCYAPKATRQMAQDLGQLKKTTIKSEQWKDFVQRVDEKIQQLKNTYQQEVKSCRELRSSLLTLGPLEAPSVAVCGPLQCQQNFSADQDEVKKAQGRRPTAENLARAFHQGQLGLLEYYLSKGQDKNLIASLIRFRLGDEWNGRDLLDSASRSHPLFSSLLKAATFSSFGHGPEAVRALRSAKQHKKGTWSKQWRERIKERLLAQRP